MKQSAQVTNITILFALQSTFCIFLMWYRNAIVGDNFYSFMLLNLVLAWIPLICSYFLQVKQPLYINLSLLVVWFFFLPNAGYVITDIMHLGERRTPTMWLDTLLLFSFAFTCLSLSGFSTKLVFDVVKHWFDNVRAWVIILITLGLGSVGVYIGRFLRFNSWDIVSAPFSIAKNTFIRYSDPISHPVSVPFTVIIFLILLTNFLFIKFLTDTKRK